MIKTITITRKGQTTLPAVVRQALGVKKDGGILEIKWNQRRGEAILSKPVSVIELGKRFSHYIKPGKKPLFNVDEYYQKHRNNPFQGGRS